MGGGRDFVAGIPGEVRNYLTCPNEVFYDWEGRTVKDFDPRVNWHA